MAVHRVGRLLIGILSGGTDARETHLPVNPFARAMKLRFHCVVKVVQSHGRSIPDLTGTRKQKMLIDSHTFFEF